MTPYLHVFQDPPLDGPTNMARDEHLLHSDELRPAAIRIYAWSPPTISLGYFQRFARLAPGPDEELHIAEFGKAGMGACIAGIHDKRLFV